MVSQQTVCADSSLITPCKVHCYDTDEFPSLGLQKGDTLSLDSLLSTSLRPINLDSLFLSRKYLLVVSGSSSCPKTQKEGDTPLRISQAYKDVSVIFVYLDEAHTSDGASPFTNSEGGPVIHLNNQSTYSKHTYMFQRQKAARLHAKKFGLERRTYLDNSNNFYLRKFAAGPSCAYLVDNRGVVIFRQPWFNKKGRNIYQDLNQVLQSKSE